MPDLTDERVEDLRQWLSFPVGDDPPSETIYALLAERETLREALRAAAYKICVVLATLRAALEGASE